MSGEIRLQATEGLTIHGLIVGVDSKVWNGTSMVAPSTLSDAEWTASLIACAEHHTGDTTGTGLYWADWPGTLTLDAIYDVVFFSGAAPVPGDLYMGIQHNPTEHQVTGDGTAGAGTVEVDHDTGGTDNLRYITANGIGIDNAVIYAFLRDDWNAGKRGMDAVRARSLTNVEGRWEWPMLLDPDWYVMYYFEQGDWGPDTITVQVI